MWATGTGSDVWKRITAAMAGGIFTSFVLELVVYPAIYEIWEMALRNEARLRRTAARSARLPAVARGGGGRIWRTSPGQKLGARGGCSLKLARVPLSDT